MTGASDAAGAILRLRAFVVVAGVATALVFVVVGLAFDLQTYGDGSLFSYAVAAQDSWAFHWRNISARMTVYLLNVRPGEIAVGSTGDPRAGLFVYGVLSFAAQAAGLAATFALDRTPARRFFVFACASTAALCPLCFGFPTEALVSHALFWPAFAAAHCPPRARAASLGVFMLMLALVFTHEAALGLALGIVASLFLRGWRDPAFVRAALCFAVIVAIWLVVDRAFPPDAYFAEVRLRAASEFFQRRIFSAGVLILMCVALCAYAALLVALSRMRVRYAHAVAAGVVACGLALWWTLWDGALHADDRYYMRTVLLVGTCIFAAICGLAVLRDEGARVTRLPAVAKALDMVARAGAARALAGALALVLLAHAVETVKFVRAWDQYRAAVRALATGEASDPQLGDPAFVTSARIAPALNRLSWFSTTPYLSAIVADFRPRRLVVDPSVNYFWISCATAATQGPAVPEATRALIRAYACAHER